VLSHLEDRGQDEDSEVRAVFQGEEVVRVITEPSFRFWVPGPLPGMNEIVKAAKGAGGKGYGYAKLKSMWTETVAMHALAASIPKGKLSRVRLSMRWIEKRGEHGSERDPDNIEAGQKFLWDGLVRAKILPNDRRVNNAGSSHAHAFGPVAGVEGTIVDVANLGPPI
jgi:hypothetical protein